METIVRDSESSSDDEFYDAEGMNTLKTLELGF